MTPQIQIIRMKSARLKRLYEARIKVAELRYTLLYGDIFLMDPLKELLSRLDYKIMAIEAEIQGVVKTITGYNDSIHVKVHYISQAEMKAGIVNISLADNGKDFLDLNTGEIVLY